VRDIEHHLHKGKYNIKALTDRARTVMGKELGGPWQMAADVFFMGVAPEKLDKVLGRLRELGLQIEADDVDVAQFTDW